MPCALFFPADYSVGMANLGLHYIYRALSEEGAAPERFFASPYPFRSVERDTMLERFPIIMVSVSYECDLVTLVSWLSSAGIDPDRRTRAERGGPVVIVGGAVTYIDPLCAAPVADAIVLGDGTATTREIIRAIRSKGRGTDVLSCIEGIDTVFVPSLHWQSALPERRMTARTDIESDPGVSTWMTPNTVFGRTLLVELQRGCARGCRYCTLPSCFAPMRQTSVGRAVQIVRDMSSTCDFERVGLVTPEAGDFRGIDDLLGAIEESGKGVSFASLRVDALNERMISAVTRGGRHALTIAPETGSDALRLLCGKRFTNEDIVRKVRLAKDAGINDIKMYFMIGLPDESEEDIAAAADLCRSVRDETGARITASISPFVPKPGTSWEFAPFLGEKEIKRRLGVMKKALRGGSGITLRGNGAREACLEYALSWSGLRPETLFHHAGMLKDRGGMDRDGQGDKADREKLLEALTSLGSRKTAADVRLHVRRP